RLQFEVDSSAFNAIGPNALLVNHLSGQCEDVTSAGIINGCGVDSSGSAFSIDQQTNSQLFAGSVHNNSPTFILHPSPATFSPEDSTNTAFRNVNQLSDVLTILVDTGDKLVLTDHSVSAAIPEPSLLWLLLTGSLVLISLKFFKGNGATH